MRLELVGAWRRSVVVRMGLGCAWLEILAGDSDARACAWRRHERVGELTDLAATQRVRDLLARLVDDRDADVRYNAATIAAAGLAATGEGLGRESPGMLPDMGGGRAALAGLMEMVRHGSRDRAWMRLPGKGGYFCGLLRPAPRATRQPRQGWVRRRDRKSIGGTPRRRWRKRWCGPWPRASTAMLGRRSRR